MKTSKRHYLPGIALLFLLSLSFAACGSAQASTTNNGTPTPVTVNLGYFPNITHAVALVGVQRGTFQQALGANTLKTTTFSAGPALIEALKAGSIDIGYVGPSPAINGYVTTHGEGLRIIAGASSGGALFIVNPAAHIQKASDLNGKKIATPQKGGTQYISLLHYLQQNGLKSNDQGGTVQVIPTDDNATIITEFKLGQIDGAWVPEPYASRLIQEDKGTIFVDERTLWPDGKFVTTNVIVRKAFLDQYPNVVAAFLKAHVETVQYINNNLAQAETIVNDQLKALGGKALSQKVLDQAFKNLNITYDPLAKTLFTSANNTYALGFLGTSKPDLTNIYDLDPLNTVLKNKGLATVSAS